MKKIKLLKTGNKILENFNPSHTDENGNKIWDIPQDVAEFKELALDTINWQTGSSVKKAVGSSATNLSASNAKAIALLTKLLETLNPDKSSLSKLEKDSYAKIVNLANNGYSNSELLNQSLTAVITNIQKGTDKATRVATATTHEEIINILNEDENVIQL